MKANVEKKYGITFEFDTGIAQQTITQPIYLTPSELWVIRSGIRAGAEYAESLNESQIQFAVEVIEAQKCLAK